MRRRVLLPYGIEGWIPDRRIWRGLVGAVGFIAEALCYMALGAGIAVLVQALHRGGITP